MTAKMGLFRYFNPEEKQENTLLPDPSGPLSTIGDHKADHKYFVCEIS